MTCCAGIDGSLETSSICIVDQAGSIVREKVEAEPEALAAALTGLDLVCTRVGLEAGPLSQWLHGSLTVVGLPVVLLETQQWRATTGTMPIKTDRTDARAIAQMVRTALDDLLSVVLAGSGWLLIHIVAQPCRSMGSSRACKVTALPGTAGAADGTEAAGDQAA